MSEKSQALQALELANRIRLTRVAYKRDVTAGRRRIGDLLESLPPELEGMTLGQLLRAQRRWGLTRVRKFCSRVGIGESRALGQLTERQRMIVTMALLHGVEAVADEVRVADEEPEPEPEPVVRELPPAKPSRVPIKLPATPFVDWLNRRMPNEGMEEWANRHRISLRSIYRIRKDKQARVHIETVDRVLSAAGEHIGDIYPELYERV